METPACISTCFDVKLDISEATSRSISVERDASWFSMVDARLADANPSRFCAAPMVAREVLSVSIALLIAVSTVSELDVFVPVNAVPLMPSALWVVESTENVKSSSDAVVPVPTF